MLSEREFQAYRETGFVVVADLVPKGLIHQANAVLAQWVSESSNVSAHNAMYDLEPSHSSASPRVRRIKKPHAHNPVFQEILRLPAMVSALKKLLGPGLRLHNSKLNLKAPHIGSPVEWHQDWAFYPHTNDDVLAIGVMLDDTTEANGAMYIVPGSHKGPTYNHHDEQGFFCGAIDLDKEGLDVSSRIACEGKAGSVSFHHVRAIHGSAQNTSPHSRGLLLYEVCAADAYPIMGVKDFADFRANLFAGEETIEPRVVPAPIRMPLPPARNQGSIYENQGTGKRYFGFKA